MSAYSIREVIDENDPAWRFAPEIYLGRKKKLMVVQLAERFMREFAAEAQPKRDPESGELLLKFECQLIEWNRFEKRLAQERVEGKRLGVEAGLALAADSLPYGLAEGVDERYQVNERGEYE